MKLLPDTQKWGTAAWAMAASQTWVPAGRHAGPAAAPTSVAAGGVHAAWSGPQQRPAAAAFLGKQ